MLTTIKVDMCIIYAVKTKTIFKWGVARPMQWSWIRLCYPLGIYRYMVLTLYINDTPKIFKF